MSNMQKMYRNFGIYENRRSQKNYKKLEKNVSDYFYLNMQLNFLTFTFGYQVLHFKMSL